jgi:hypothetical protein
LRKKTTKNNLKQPKTTNGREKEKEKENTKETRRRIRKKKKTLALSTAFPQTFNIFLLKSC